MKYEITPGDHWSLRAVNNDNRDLYIQHLAVRMSERVASLCSRSALNGSPPCEQTATEFRSHSWNTVEYLHQAHNIDGQGPVSLRLMTSQFKDIVTRTQK